MSHECLSVHVWQSADSFPLLYDALRCALLELQALEVPIHDYSRLYSTRLLDYWILQVSFSINVTHESYYPSTSSPIYLLQNRISQVTSRLHEERIENCKQEYTICNLFQSSPNVRNNPTNRRDFSTHINFLHLYLYNPCVTDSSLSNPNRWP